MTQGNETKVSSFDEWYFKQNHLGIEPIDHARESYRAGAASRQAEIDELQKRIKAIQKTAQRIMVAIDDDEIEYARRSAIKMFKGGSNE